MSDKGLFKGLRVCTPEKNDKAISSVPKKKRVLIVKSTFLRRISPAFLASGLVQDDDLPDVWQSGSMNIVS